MQNNSGRDSATPDPMNAALCDGSCQQQKNQSPFALTGYKSDIRVPNSGVARKVETKRLLETFTQMDELRGSSECPIPFIESPQRFGTRSFLFNFQSFVPRDTPTGSLVSSARRVDVTLYWGGAIWRAFRNPLNVHFKDFSSLLHWISCNSPLYISIEIMGRATNRESSLGEYITKWIKPLTSIRGVYLVLDILPFVGSMFFGFEVNRTIPRMVRIHLMPLNLDDITKILTRSHIQVKCPGHDSIPIKQMLELRSSWPDYIRVKQGEDIIEIVGRYLSSISDGIEDSAVIATYFDTLTTQVSSFSGVRNTRDCVFEFPREVAEIFFKHEIGIDLTLTIDSDKKDINLTMEFLVLFMNLGFDYENVRCSRVYIPPRTEAILSSYFLSFDEYVEFVGNRRYPVRDGSPLVNIFLRYFETVVGNGSQTIGRCLPKGAIPVRSWLHEISIALNPLKRRYCWASVDVREGYSERLEGLDELVSIIAEMLRKGETGIVSPHSYAKFVPDFFMVGLKCIVGVVVGMKKHKTAYEGFVELVEDLFVKGRCGGALEHVAYVVLCLDGFKFEKSVGNGTREKSILIHDTKGDALSMFQCELIFINIGLSNLLREFCMKATNKSHIIDIIENIVTGDLKIPSDNKTNRQLWDWRIPDNIFDDRVCETYIERDSDDDGNDTESNREILE